MNLIKINFIPKAPTEDEESLTDLLWDYLGCLYKNGQILKDYSFIKNDAKYIAFVTLPEDDALNEAYNNIYVSKYLDEVKAHLEISTEMLGENLNTDKSCDCTEKPEWYMLYSDWSDEESPVVCGRCGKSVPLYKLPHILGQDEHYGVLCWKEAYKSTDSLFVYCLSDRFTYRQMNNTDSRLSKDAREICAEFEEATRIPVYYYLFHYKKTPAVCPSCGGDWKLIDEKSFIEYKCDKCRLVADEV
jgi:predicted  nucleic acid-binding Zn ribbon protein